MTTLHSSSWCSALIPKDVARNSRSQRWTQNGYGRYRLSAKDSASIPPNEFRHFDALLSRIAWRWVACVADAAAIVVCVVDHDASMKCPASNPYLRHYMRLGSWREQTADQQIILRNGSIPEGFR
eukprot:7263400-Prymnesium_polylepis.4